jgi:hypothetical protein
MTEKEKMIAGLYNVETRKTAGVPEFTTSIERNRIPITKKARGIIAELIPNANFTSSRFTDYGYYCGDNGFNVNCVVLDCAQ